MGARVVRIEPAAWPDDRDTVRELFLEYAAGLGFDLCFQGFDQELDTLPGWYASPGGRLLVASLDDEVVGCVALRGFEAGTCEMKRLYVRPAARGSRVGRALVERVLAEARAAGYRRMRLDTIEPLMAAAIALYRRLGFVEIPPYTGNSIAGVMYLECDLGCVDNRLAPADNASA
jgi:ribosomal protein S18 acetylase RimI-like enzyme